MVEITSDVDSVENKEEKLKAACVGNPFKIFWCEGKQSWESEVGSREGFIKMKEGAIFLYWLELSSREEETLTQERTARALPCVEGTRDLMYKRKGEKMALWACGPNEMSGDRGGKETPLLIASSS